MNNMNNQNINFMNNTHGKKNDKENILNDNNHNVEYLSNKFMHNSHDEIIDPGHGQNPHANTNKRFNVGTNKQNYHDMLPSLSNNKIKNFIANNSQKKTLTLNIQTKNRIDFAKNLLYNSKLLPMVDFDNCDTESSSNPRLNKRIMDIQEIFDSMNIRLSYLKSGTTGHTFKATCMTDPNIQLAVKVCAYPKDDYGGMNNLSRPENVELLILKRLSYFVVNRISPHFVIPMGTFNTEIGHFINVHPNVIDLNDEKNESYKIFIERYMNKEFEDFVSILVSEWCDGGDLLDYIRKNYKEMDKKKWTVIFFQLLYTLANIHNKYPTFRHNDMKANNILVQKTEEKSPNHLYQYKIENCKFIIPNIGIQIKIWDFDFACIDGEVRNSKVDSEWTKNINISHKKNQYYDINYFFNTLMNPRFFPQFYKKYETDEIDENGERCMKNCVPQEIIDFVHRVVPEIYRVGSKCVTRKGRILVNTQYKTPLNIILNDVLFKKFKFSIDD